MPAPIETVLRAHWQLRLANFLGSVALIAAACAAYRALPVHAPQFARVYGGRAFEFSGDEFLLTAAATYSVCLACYFAADRSPRESKSLRFLRVAALALKEPRRLWADGLDRESRLALLASLLKMFFAPLMVMSLLLFCNAAITNGWALMQPGTWGRGFRFVFDRYGFWFLIQVIIFVDLLIFNLGYLVESRRLGNTIRSVDPTLLGWGAAIMCYPPFNAVTSALLASPVSDFPRFDDPMAHLALNGLLLLLMALYAWSSVAMGWKASNLTYRGMVEHGPYSLVRHPAYVCKNLAWWIGSIPAVSAAFTVSALAGLTALGAVIGWSALYVLRALTEEDHLRKLGDEYAAYASRVRYRFIPGVA